MTNEDKVIADTAARRNDLEAYVYEIRDRLMADLSDYVADEAKGKFMSQLDEVCAASCACWVMLSIFAL